MTFDIVHSNVVNRISCAKFTRISDCTSKDICSTVIWSTCHSTSQTGVYFKQPGPTLAANITGLYVFFDFHVKVNQQSDLRWKRPLISCKHFEMFLQWYCLGKDYLYFQPAKQHYLQANGRPNSLVVFRWQSVGGLRSQGCTGYGRPLAINANTN